MTTYEMHFSSYADATEYFSIMNMTRLPAKGIETWAGTTYTDDGDKRVLLARGSIMNNEASIWQFSEQ